MLQRLWTAIVGAVAGAAVGFVVAIVLMQNGEQIGDALAVVWMMAGLGALLGLVFGGPKQRSSREALAGSTFADNAIASPQFGVRKERSAVRRHVKNMLVLTVVLNSPAIFIWIPWTNLIFFMPFLFWINIPALWCGLAGWTGTRHFDVQEFGAMPLTPLAWLLIVAFWTLVAAGLTLLAAGVPRLKRQFGLRTLFIAATLLAIVLGLVGYAVR
jgi:hypothetical protein